jgi:hypothetical protein
MSYMKTTIHAPCSNKHTYIGRASNVDPCQLKLHQDLRFSTVQKVNVNQFILVYTVNKRFSRNNEACQIKNTFEISMIMKSKCIWACIHCQYVIFKKIRDTWVFCIYFQKYLQTFINATGRPKAWMKGSQSQLLIKSLENAFSVLNMHLVSSSKRFIIAFMHVFPYSLVFSLFPYLYLSWVCIIYLLKVINHNTMVIL